MPAARLFYAIGLSLAGLNFGFLIGIISGLINFIPFVGSLTGLVLSVGVATAQFWPDWTMIVVIVAIFGAGSSSKATFCSPSCWAMPSGCIRSG